MKRRDRHACRERKKMRQQHVENDEWFPSYLLSYALYFFDWPVYVSTYYYLFYLRLSPTTQLRPPSIFHPLFHFPPSPSLLLRSPTFLRPFKFKRQHENYPRQMNKHCPLFISFVCIPFLLGLLATKAHTVPLHAAAHSGLHAHVLTLRGLSHILDVTGIRRRRRRRQRGGSSVAGGRRWHRPGCCLICREDRGGSNKGRRAAQVISLQLRASRGAGGRGPVKV